ncbi:hypothetical protein B0T17DRAFT_487756 [Bombardia bombarda]|uniref:Gfd2/YDR514C-like C-terminal domain-containing protein n=1 Tax=Bombardia bombarda TaxID=252184 RepID=A0AA39XCI7_9PEZI|nr:hypothetical protein B0T17DRAFT_487756 [Bombardia bombarda]
MEDNEFLRRLQALTGRTDIWEGFDPAQWREPEPEPEDEEMETTTANADGEDCWSDDMIMGAHHLTPQERIQNNLPPQPPRNQGRSYKLNKAREYAADGPAPLLDATHLEKVGWKETGLQMGDMSATSDTFTPWKLVKEYPEMFVGKLNGERAAPLFTMEALHKNRIWDLYYIHHPREDKKGPVVFVPTYQFEHLLLVVNAKLDTNLTIPHGVNAEKFAMTFGYGNTPRPRFLGRATSLEMSESLRNSIPAPQPSDQLENVTQLGRERFVESLESIYRNAKKSKKSDKSHKKRLESRGAWGRSLKRVQRYLGLRQKVDDADRGSSPSWDSSQEELDSFYNPVKIPQSLNLQAPMTIDPEGSVLFVAIDIEAYEFNQSIITEIGIAILDTTKISKVAPGEGGKGWFPVVRARHLRVKENAWAINSTHVHGCAEYFDFGTSEFVPKAEIPTIIKSIIDNAVLIDASGIERKRPVVLVFHDSAQDIKYLQTLKYDIYEAKNVIEIADTREMQQYVSRSQNPSKLLSILVTLDIPYRYLHNAGNDAVYTLFAMIGLAVKKRLASLEKAEKKSQKSEGHVPYKEFCDNEGWSSNGENSDGGLAAKPVNQSN